MTRIMYDSINIQGIPRTGAEIIPWYINGKYAVTLSTVNARFPEDKFSLPPIDVFGDMAHYARILDVETGDASPEQCEQWITDFNRDNPAYKTGGRPEIYCDRDNIGAVRTGTGKYLLGRDYFLWVATGDGTIYTGDDLAGPYAKEGVNACQIRWYRTYDSSVVFTDKWMPTP